jgi:hypothetical protein
MIYHKYDVYVCIEIKTYKAATQPQAINTSSRFVSGVCRKLGDGLIRCRYMETVVDLDSPGFISVSVKFILSIVILIVQ